MGPGALGARFYPVVDLVEQVSEYITGSAVIHCPNMEGDNVMELMFTMKNVVWGNVPLMVAGHNGQLQIVTKNVEKESEFVPENA